MHLIFIIVDHGSASDRFLTKVGMGSLVGRGGLGLQGRHLMGPRDTFEKNYKVVANNLNIKTCKTLTTRVIMGARSIRCSGNFCASDVQPLMQFH